MRNPTFDLRMAELDAIVRQCADEAAFGTGTVRDASNRSGRDWPWWGVQIVRTRVCGAESRRVRATVTLHSTETGEPGAFEGCWQAQVWWGVGADTFHETGSRPLDWQVPTAQMLHAVMAALLADAEAAMPPQAGT